MAMLGAPEVSCLSRVLREGCVCSRTTEARHMKTHPSPSLAEGHGGALAAKTLVNSHFTLKHNPM